jgi:CRP-like cAMP-binding protein
MLFPFLSIVTLATGAALGEDLYFPLSGLVSRFVPTSEGQMLHTELVGTDGAVGLTGLGNSMSSIRSAVLVPGAIAKISRSIFHDIWSRSAALQELVVRYSELMLYCAHQSAACNALHAGRERLCTWLLRAHDLLKEEGLPFTQEVLADMIGVTRSTVTLFAHDLQNEGILQYARGHIKVMNRPELERQACECYRLTRRCVEGAFHGTVDQTDTLQSAHPHDEPRRICSAHNHP